jgi:hypothetical protein
MAEIDLHRLHALIKDLADQAEEPTYVMAGEPPGARGAWTTAYHRYLGLVREQFPDDPLLDVAVQELPEEASYGHLLVSMRQLQAYLAQRLSERVTPPGPLSSEAGQSIAGQMADIGREIGATARLVSAAEPGEGLEAKLDALQSQMERLEADLGRLLGSEE